jgi:hypothetical protein
VTRFAACRNKAGIVDRTSVPKALRKRPNRQAPFQKNHTSVRLRLTEIRASPTVALTHDSVAPILFSRSVVFLTGAPNGKIGRALQFSQHKQQGPELAIPKNSRKM